MGFEFKTLDKETFYNKVKQFVECYSLDVKKFVLDSEVIYSNTYDFMFNIINISVLKNNNSLYLLHSIDEDKWLEPLLIQLDDNGVLLDGFLREFISKYDGSLDGYLITCIEFSVLMEEVRRAKEKTVSE